ncbi:hypothetical protein D3C75_1313510 [compost metagenome]
MRVHLGCEPRWRLHRDLCSRQQGDARYTTYDALLPSTKFLLLNIQVTVSVL